MMQVAPVASEHLWEFCLFFCSYYLANRLLLWWLHRACEGGDQEMWRGSQMSIWLAFNHCKAVWKVRLTQTAACADSARTATRPEKVAC